MSSNALSGVERCNVCDGGETDHHLVAGIERVFGASVWVYDDGFARVVPWHTRSLFADSDHSEVRR